MFKKIIPFSIIMVLLAFLVTSCFHDKSSGMDKSTGKTNELMIITNTKDQWNGNLGDTLRTFFEQEMLGLPQAEPIFTTFNVAEKKFNKTFKKLHSIFIANIDPSVKTTMLEVKRDLWTAPQQVIKISAPNQEEFYKKFNEYKETFLRLYLDLEIERTNKYFGMASSVPMRNQLKKKFGISLDVPGGFYVGREAKNFIWLRQSIHKTKQDIEIGILIYQIPYNDTNLFHPNRILQIRDSITHDYVHGELPGTYVAVSRDFIPTISERTANYVTDFAVETRGLWHLVNDFMGGPFLSYTIVTPDGTKVLTLDGYVYNPSGMKRNFVRQLEAIFYTLEFVE